MTTSKDRTLSNFFFLVAIVLLVLAVILPEQSRYLVPFGFISLAAGVGGRIQFSLWTMLALAALLVLLIGGFFIFFAQV
jgi:hypothetical protein